MAASKPEGQQEGKTHTPLRHFISKAEKRPSFYGAVQLCSVRQPMSLGSLVHKPNASHNFSAPPAQLGFPPLLWLTRKGLSGHVSALAILTTGHSHCGVYLEGRGQRALWSSPTAINMCRYSAASPILLCGRGCLRGVYAEAKVACSERELIILIIR